MDGNLQTQPSEIIFLPVSEAQVDAFERGELALADLNAFGRAAILVLLAFLRDGQSMFAHAERMLVDLADAVRDTDALTLDTLAQQALGQGSLHELRKRVAEAGFRFLKEADLREQRFLKNGQWDWEFQLTYGAPLAERPSASGVIHTSSDQHRILSTLLAEPDEDIDVQGFAGTGKTHLIRLVAELSPEYFTYIAPSHNQRDALTLRIGATNLRALSLFQLSRSMTAHLPLRFRQQSKAAPHEYMSDAELAIQLDVPWIDEHSPRRVVGICQRAVQRFCHSVDDTILAEHFFGLIPTFSPGMPVWLGCAYRLWDFIIEQPHPHKRATRRAYHSVKFMALSGLTAPEALGSLIVDEAHDLSAPWRQILSRSTRGVLLLGDKYQHLGGSPSSMGVRRHRSMTQSVRVGESAAGIVNEALQAHPQRPDIEFAGSRQRHTRIRPYDDLKLGFVERDLVLFASPWSLLAFVQRCAHAGARYRVLSATATALTSLVTDLDDLFHRQQRPSYYLVQPYGTWDELHHGVANNAAALSVLALFERGYSRQRLRSVLDNQAADDQRDVIVMGLAEHGKNIEADVVVLGPDLFEREDDRKRRRGGTRQPL